MQRGTRLEPPVYAHRMSVRVCVCFMEELGLSWSCSCCHVAHSHYLVSGMDSYDAPLDVFTTHDAFRTTLSTPQQEAKLVEMEDMAK